MNKFFEGLFSLTALAMLLMAMFNLFVQETEKGQLYALLAVAFILLENQCHRDVREEQADRRNGIHR